MIIIETAIAATMLCYSAKRCQCGDGHGLFSVSTATIGSCVISSGKTAEVIMSDEFNEIAGVENVTVTREGLCFSVEVDMSMFDRTTRRQVYAKERELYERFPKYSLSVHLNDRSQVLATNAISG